MAAPSSLHDESGSGEHHACENSHDGSHDLHVRGYWPAGRVPGVDCDQPVRWACRDCVHAVPRACGCHRASKCVPCSWRYRRRLVQVADSGAHRASGHSYFLTLTAPGTTPHMQFDPGHVRGRRSICGCDEGVALADWNPTAGQRWNHLRTLINRRGRVEFMRVVEVQQRGALHLHVMVWSPVPLDVLAIQRDALAAGFGCVLDLVPLDAQRHAYYVAKYVTKACDSRDEVPWRTDVLDESTGEIRPMHTDASYRAWSASREWGLTMRVIREALRARAIARAAEVAALPLVAPEGAPVHDLPLAGLAPAP